MSSRRRWPRRMVMLHAITALGIGVVVPIGSWLFGSGELAYGMYAHANEYRLTVSAVDEAGVRHPIAPAELARGARPSVVPFLAGADHWRSSPRITDVRSSLSSFATHACETRPRRERIVEITMEEREREGAAVRATRATATCIP